MDKPNRARTGTNRLLDSLPKSEQTRLYSKLERVSSALKDVVYEPNGPVENVYFPLTGVFSMVIIMRDGMVVEAATVGNEGMVGMSVFLGANSSPQKALCQVPAESLRMSADDLRRELKRSGPLTDLLKRYNQGLMNQMAQSVACNRIHPIEERMARWLLMSHDRVNTDHILLTQEFLAQMLGVRRPSVTVAAGVLEKAGLIAVGRGKITVLNRERLEAAACECYQVVRDEFDRLLGKRAG